MKLYLMRHGNAVDPSVDPDCPLSESGRTDITRMAKFFEKNAEVRVSKLYHSQKLRAKQTAGLIASTVLTEGSPKEITGLNPTDSVLSISDEIVSWQEDTWLVGHLPFMPRLVSRLLTGDENKLLVAFQQGSVICLEKEREEASDWLLNWYIRPHLLV